MTTDDSGIRRRMLRDVVCVDLGAQSAAIGNRGGAESTMSYIFWSEFMCLKKPIKIKFYPTYQKISPKGMPNFVNPMLTICL